MISEPLTWQGSTHDVAAPPTRPVVAFLTFAAVLVALLVSGYMLMEFGIPYGTAGGSPLSKIHPMTYLAIVAFAAAALARGNPLSYIAECAAKFPGTTYFVLMLIVMIVWTLLIQHQPLTSLVDTFLPAALFAFLISDLTPRQHRLLTILIHVAMNANALLGLVEVVSGWRLTPLVLVGLEVGAPVEWEWRASAFLGHPLENAVLSAVYMLMMIYGADRSVSPGLRVTIVVLQIAGQVAFGGRTAMVLSYALVGVRVLMLMMTVLRGRRFDPRIGALIIMLMPLVIGGGLLAYDLGAFDRVLERFTNDNGSADSRLSMLRIFNSFSLYDLLMGPDPEVLTEKTVSEGTLAGIESFIFGFFLQSGMIISLIFFCGLAAITYDLWRIGSGAGLISIGFFYVVAAGAASLSVKGQSLAQFVILFTTIEAMPALSDREQSEAARGRSL